MTPLQDCELNYHLVEEAENNNHPHPTPHPLPQCSLLSSENAGAMLIPDDLVIETT